MHTQLEKNRVCFFLNTRSSNSTTKFVIKARESFSHDLVESNMIDTKQFWKKVGKILPGKMKTHKQVVLLDDDSNPIDDCNTPDVMNQYFTEIGPKLASSMNVEWSFCGNGVDQTIPELMIDITTVRELINQINTNKSSALDGISATALKDGLQSIPEQLTYFFNKSLASKTVPLAWKSGLVIPIPKGGFQSKCNNYRPITLVNNNRPITLAGVSEAIKSWGGGGSLCSEPQRPVEKVLFRRQNDKDLSSFLFIKLFQ